MCIGRTILAKSDTPWLAGMPRSLAPVTVQEDARIIGRSNVVEFDVK